MSSFLSPNFFSTQSLMEKISGYLMVLISCIPGSQSFFDESHEDRLVKQDLEKKGSLQGLTF